MRISFNPQEFDHCLLNSPADWEAFLADQRRINGNPRLHEQGPDPFVYPCVALVDGILEGGWSYDRLNVIFLPDPEILEAENGQG